MSAPSRQPFQTDVRRTRGLQVGHISLVGPSSSSSNRRNAALTGPEDAQEAREAAQQQLKDKEERLNKHIDEHIRTLEIGMADLIGGFGVADKNLSRLELEAFMYEYRCDTIVKSVQGLSGLSRALQLSLLLSQGPQEQDAMATQVNGSSDHGQETERQRLKREIQEMQAKAGGLVSALIGKGSEGASGTMEDPPPLSDEEEDGEPLQSRPSPVGLVDQLIGAAIDQQEAQMATSTHPDVALLGLPPFQEESAAVLQLPLDPNLTSRDGSTGLTVTAPPQPAAGYNGLDGFSDQAQPTDIDSGEGAAARQSATGVGSEADAGI